MIKFPSLYTAVTSQVLGRLLGIVCWCLEVEVFFSFAFTSEKAGVKLILQVSKVSVSPGLFWPPWKTYNRGIPRGKPEDSRLCRFPCFLNDARILAHCMSAVRTLIVRSDSARQAQIFRRTRSNLLH